MRVENQASSRGFDLDGLRLAGEVFQLNRKRRSAIDGGSQAERIGFNRTESLECDARERLLHILRRAFALEVNDAHWLEGDAEIFSLDLADGASKEIEGAPVGPGKNRGPIVGFLSP